MRKAIDYFCHLAVAPEFYSKIKERDIDFAKSDFFQKMSWLKDENDNIYDPSYTDMLRVAFTVQFKRGKLSDLVALLSGRNFETKQYEDEIARLSFEQLKRGIMDFMNETHFKRFTMIIRSAGFVDASLITSQNALDFAYVLYLTLRTQNMPPAFIERVVRKWFVMSLLRGRYSGSTESIFDYDIRQIHALGFEQYANALDEAELSDAFWTALLPQELITSSANSPLFRVYLAAQVAMNDKGFLSRDITVRDLLTKGDIHHLFPRNYLKKQGYSKSMYNQIANYVITQTEINIAIGDNDPAAYFEKLHNQANGGKLYFGGISDQTGLYENFRMNCIPDSIDYSSSNAYEAFLEERRKLIAAKIRDYYLCL